MNLIKRITDFEVLGAPPEYLYSVSRFGARGILVDHNKNVAMMYMSKSDIYKLPGGGVHEGENAKDAFLREIKEETGFEAEIIHEIGYIEEHKSRNDFMQLSYCFIAKVIDASIVSYANLTESEQRSGMEVKWMTVEEALRAMNHSLKACDDYSNKFMIFRDKAVLEHGIMFLTDDKLLSFGDYQHLKGS